MIGMTGDSSMMSGAGVDGGRAWDARRARQRYLVATAACGVFGVVYELFSHGVYSPFMVGLPAFPLLLGVLPASLVAWRDLRVPEVSGTLLSCAVMTLSFGSALVGVFEIYGTTSPLTMPYWVVGVLLVMAAVLVSRRWRD